MKNWIHACFCIVFVICLINVKAEDLSKVGLMSPPVEVIQSIRKQIDKMDYEKASAFLMENLRLFPNNAELKLLDAICLYHKLKFEESLAQLKKAKDLGLDSAELYQYIGMNYNAVSKDDLALENFKESIKRKEDPYVYSIMASIFEIRKNYEENYKIIKRILEITKGDTFYLSLLAKYYLNIGKLDLAEEK